MEMKFGMYLFSIGGFRWSVWLQLPQYKVNHNIKVKCYIGDGGGDRFLSS